MSTAADRFEAIQNIYSDALNNEPSDLARAQTAADVTAIQANFGNARSAYFAAVVAALTSTDAAVEAALGAAQKALAQVKAARTDAASIPTLLGLLTSATGAATNLLNIAKSVT